MNIRVDSNNGIEVVRTDHELIENRKIFIEGYIDYSTAVRFVKTLLMLNIRDNREFIDVVIDSPGAAEGDIRPGLMIYDAIWTCLAPVRMFCVGRAYGIAGVLFICGKGSRYIMPHAHVSFSESSVHLPEITGAEKADAAQSLENTRIICGLLKHHTDKSYNAVKKLIDSNKVLNADECLNKHLCDRIGGIDWLSYPIESEDADSLPFP